MPAQFNNIDDTIVYILDNWIQNNNQYITGTIGQNVVWNLAEFIRKNPENWEKATVVTTSSNYTTSSGECIVIFTNNASGDLSFVDNIWNKYYFVNGTDNDRDFFNGKSYIDINGTVIYKVAARSSVYIAKGIDDFWYEIITTSTTNATKKPLVGIVGAVGMPIAGSPTFQSNDLIGVGSTNNGYITILIDGGALQNYGNQKSIEFNSTLGIINLDYNSSGNTFQDGASLSIDLNQ